MNKKITIALLIAFLPFQSNSMASPVYEKITLSEDNVLIMDSNFTSKSVASLLQEAKKKDTELKSGYPMYLFMYTPGGSIQAGLELIEFLSALNRPVHTVTWFAASMGFQTVQHLGKRYILRYGTLMSHKASGYFKGEFGGDASQIDSRYGFWLRRIKLMDEKTVERTNGKQTMKSYVYSYSPELWLNGQEAVDLGYADKVVTVHCNESLDGTRKLPYDLGFITINLIVSKCPLQTGVLGTEINMVTNQGTMLLDNFLEKNGKFDCSKIDKKEEEEKEESKKINKYSALSPVYYDDTDYDLKKINKSSEEKEQLCSRSKLTLDQVQDKIKEIKNEYARDIKDKVQRPY